MLSGGLDSDFLNASKHLQLFESLEACSGEIIIDLSWWVEKEVREFKHHVVIMRFVSWAENNVIE